MANGEIIKMKDGSTVEVLQAKPLNVALVKLEEQEDRLNAIKVEAQQLEVTDRVSFIKAGELVAEIKRLTDDAESTTAPFATIIKRAKEFIQVRERRVTNLGTIVHDLLNGKMGAYTTRVDAERLAEEQRVQRAKQAELERAAEKQRQDDLAASAELKKQRVNAIREDLRAGKITKRQAEKLLREAGAEEEAQKAQAAADAEDAKAKAAETAKQTTVKSEVPKVAGVVQRTNRKFKVVKPALVKLKYLKPDLVAIGEIVRDKKLTIEQVIAEVGGIEVWEEKTF